MKTEEYIIGKQSVVLIRFKTKDMSIRAVGTVVGKTKEDFIRAYDKAEEKIRLELQKHGISV
jgi:hypothetical protein